MLMEALVYPKIRTILNPIPGLEITVLGAVLERDTDEDSQPTADTPGPHELGPTGTAVRR